MAAAWGFAIAGLAQVASSVITYFTQPKYDYVESVGEKEYKRRLASGAKLAQRYKAVKSMVGFINTYRDPADRYDPTDMKYEELLNAIEDYKTPSEEDEPPRHIEGDPSGSVVPFLVDAHEDYPRDRITDANELEEKTGVRPTENALDRMREFGMDNIDSSHITNTPEEMARNRELEQLPKTPQPFSVTDNAEDLFQYGAGRERNK
ncbi:MAG: hypothetical protein U9N86_10160 [Bacteroidota bacterium]|nr:hypothetical protein [Bacteroidota bacterium]